MIYCAYCGTKLGNNIIRTREMMFGTRDVFDYFQCERCNSCILATPLGQFNIADHYPSNYYSFNTGDSKKISLQDRLMNARDSSIFGLFNPLGYVISIFKPGVIPRLSNYGLDGNARILDVGCGDGKFLLKLAELGKAELYGCDPYLNKEIYGKKIQIKKCAISEMTGNFDVILFNHSFEHLLDPETDLRAARQLQRANGLCVIRTPTCSSEAFDKYKQHWVQLDPPRHITIPSREGMRKLAERCGYRLKKMIDDSSHFQFWGSEQYKRDISLFSKNSYAKNKQGSVFSDAEIKSYQARAKYLNSINRGDQTAFILTPQ